MRPASYRVCRVFAVLLFLAALGLAPSRAADSSKGLAKIPEAMQGFVDKHQISGAVTLVAKEGKVVQCEAVGLADVEKNRPMEKDTMFCIASMTKPVTATALMILGDEGLLSLSDPVSKYVPAFEKTRLKDRALARPITLRDLITHTSGLGGSQQNQGTLAETVDALAAQPLAFEPGEKWQYSPGLTVCGRVVEVVARMPYEQFLAERIFRPLGMKNTTVRPSADQARRIARLYKPGTDGKSIQPAEHWLTEVSADRSPNPSGGLFSTAADMARFYQMILGGGQLDGQRIISKAAVAEMTRIQTGDLVTGFTPGNGWGLGWCVVREPQGVSAMLSPGSFGHGGAFGTQGWVDPEKKMIFVLMIQRTEFGNSDDSDIRRTFQQLAVDAMEP
ncbi:MAG: serine hydrolase domain-containing protein [Thermoguttaceae bacterium]